MTKKLKWFSIVPFTSRHLRQMIGKLRENAYSEERGRGFVLDENGPTNAVVRYVEKNDVTERVEGPFGGHTEYRIVTYTQCTLAFSLEWPHCEISDGFRASTKVLNLVSSSLNFAVTIEEQTIPLLRFVSRFRKQAPDVKISSVTVTNLQLDGHSAARFEVMSTKDAMAQIGAITGAKKHTIEQVKCLWIIAGRECSASVSADGRCLISAPDLESATNQVKAIIRLSLP